MDHGGHGGHGDGGMDMGGKCSMNMLWNTQIIDTCIVFPSWHIRSTTSFVVSFFAIVALGVLYEALRLVQREFDRRIALRQGAIALSADTDDATALHDGVNSDGADAGFLSNVRVAVPTKEPLPLLTRLARSVLYGASVFLSFFLMLVFMTYNAYLILAVVLGAVLGHFLLGSVDMEHILSGADRGMSCH